MTPLEETGINVLVVDEPTTEDRAAVAAPLLAYNQKEGPQALAEPLVLLLKDNDGQTVGGLWGKTVYNWLVV